MKRTHLSVVLFIGAGLTVVLGIYIAVNIHTQQILPRLHSELEVEGPGEAHIYFENPGEYILYYTYPSYEMNLGAARISHAMRRIPDFSYHLESESSQVDFIKDGSMTFQRGKIRGVSLYTFTIRDPGHYVLTMDSRHESEKAAFVIHQQYFHLISKIILTGLITFIMFTLFVVPAILLIVLKKQSRTSDSLQE